MMLGVLELLFEIKCIRSGMKSRILKFLSMVVSMFSV